MIYDQNYLLTQVNDSRLGQIDYQYDPVGRLVRTQGERLKESFQFDPAGNLIDAAAGQHGQIKNNLIQQYQGASYRYDHQGNVIEKQHQGQSLKLYWDNLNRLASSEFNGQTTHYGYDVFGRRLFKQTQRDLTLFGWDGDLMIWESFKANNNIQSYTKHYLYEPDSFVPLVQTGYTGFIKLLDTPDYRQYQTQAYVRDQDPLWKTDTRYKRADIERAVFYHCDQVGTPQVLSNESGEQVWAVTLDTWGQALEIKASDHLLEQTNIRFQGQYYDQETGLHYNRYRYYEPHSARYIGKDPIGLEGGINISAYVSDPNAWIDPMGLQQNDNRGLFWISPEALNESDKATRQMEENARRNPNTKSNYENIMSGEGASIPKPKTVETPVMQHFSPPSQNVMPSVRKRGPEFSGIMGANTAIKKWGERVKEDPSMQKNKKCTSGKCNLMVDYLVCSGSYYVGTSGLALNSHNGNIYGSTGFTKPSFDKAKGQLSVGASCLGFTLGELDSKIDRAILTDEVLNGASFGVAYGGAFGLAGAVDIPIAPGGSIKTNVGAGISTPGVTYFDFSNSKLIGNTKDTEPYTTGLMFMFGHL